jgi:hypothetical protein
MIVDYFVKMCKVYLAKHRLRKYMKTLSLEQRKWAEDLNFRLSTARSQAHATLILRQEADKLFERQARLTERIHRATLNHLEK